MNTIGSSWFNDGGSAEAGEGVGPVVSNELRAVNQNKGENEQAYERRIQRTFTPWHAALTHTPP